MRIWYFRLVGAALGTARGAVARRAGARSGQTVWHTCCVAGRVLWQLCAGRSASEVPQQQLQTAVVTVGAVQCTRRQVTRAMTSGPRTVRRRREFKTGQMEHRPSNQHVDPIAGGRTPGACCTDQYIGTRNTEQACPAAKVPRRCRSLQHAVCAGDVWRQRPIVSRRCACFYHCASSRRMPFRRLVQPLGRPLNPVRAGRR